MSNSNRILHRSSDRTPRPIAQVARDFQEYLQSDNKSVSVTVSGQQLHVKGMTTKTRTATYESYPVVYLD